jgi:hypothetical protein
VRGIELEDAAAASSTSWSSSAWKDLPEQQRLERPAASSAPAIAGAPSRPPRARAGSASATTGHRDCAWVSSAPSHGDGAQASSTPATAMARGRAPPATVTGALPVLMPACKCN